jgi:hypothetical protein
MCIAKGRVGIKEANRKKDGTSELLRPDDIGSGIGNWTYIVTTEDTNDFAVAVQLAEDPLLHVLRGAIWSVESGRQMSDWYSCDSPSSILAVLEASWAS